MFHRFPVSLILSLLFIGIFAFPTHLLATEFDISTASYSQSFSVNAQETGPQGVVFNTDGTKMFVMGFSVVYEYDLSTGFDISTASYSQSFSGPTFSYDVAFNTDGTKMFISSLTSASIREYDLSTGFDISTASYSQAISLLAQVGTPSGITFNTDGTKMFVSTYQLFPAVGLIDEYDLSTGFDISTYSYSQSFTVTTEEDSPQGIVFNTNGTKMFVTGTSGDSVYEYSLSTGFDISTASYSQSFSVSAQDTSPQGMTFNNNGTKMFVIGTTGDTVYEYTLPATVVPEPVPDLSTWAMIFLLIGGVYFLHREGVLDLNFSSVS